MPTNEPRVIKKYPNRRLYDTVDSKYITLSDVRRLVLDRVDFETIFQLTGMPLSTQQTIQQFL